MRFTTTRRWGDNDRHFGPFTFARDSWSHTGFMLDSGSGEYPGCHLRFYFGKYTVICELPPIIQPYREKVQAVYWDAATIERLGRDWYYNEHDREFGFYFTGGGQDLHIHYGPQTHSGDTTKSKVYFLPWRHWRYIGQRWYGLEGDLIASNYTRDYAIDMAHEAVTPKKIFRFQDYDGEEIDATTHIEEREWHFGTGWFKWLSIFRKARISRSLDIKFSSEVGRGKGSWKGGTVGHAIDMENGELHEAAFLRYCDKHELTFVAAVP